MFSPCMPSLKDIFELFYKDRILKLTMRSNGGIKYEKFGKKPPVLTNTMFWIHNINPGVIFTFCSISKCEFQASNSDAFQTLSEVPKMEFSNLNHLSLKTETGTASVQFTHIFKDTTFHTAKIKCFIMICRSSDKMPHAFAFCIRDQKKIPKGFKMLCEHFHSGIDLTERNACHVARWVTSNLSAVEEKKHYLQV